MSEIYIDPQDPQDRCRLPLMAALSDPALDQELEKVMREGGEEALKALIQDRFPDQMPLLYPEPVTIDATRK